MLLCERKRHTARRVASARYAALSPDWGGGTPFQSWLPPPPVSKMGVSSLFRPGMGVLPCQEGVGPPPPNQEE